MNAMAIETTNIILKDLGDELFSILVDESRDIGMKLLLSMSSLDPKNSFEA